METGGQDFLPPPGLTFIRKLLVVVALKHEGRQECEIFRDGEKMHAAVRDPDGNTIEIYTSKLNDFRTLWHDLMTLIFRKAVAIQFVKRCRSRVAQIFLPQGDLISVFIPLTVS